MSWEGGESGWCKGRHLVVTVAADAAKGASVGLPLKRAEVGLFHRGGDRVNGELRFQHGSASS